MVQPRYPIYVVSKGRWRRPYTARALARDGIPFRMVVEPQEAEAYALVVGKERVLTLPFANLGQGSIPARNWVWEHAAAEGSARHWVLDDNLRGFYRRWHGDRLPVESGPALRCCEDFVDRYENVAVAGLNYSTFAHRNSGRKTGMPPFYLNVHVYSCVLINTGIPFRWRGRYNEDTDLCLQVLAGGWCTVLLNAFLVQKIVTMVMRGGNTDVLYAGDGRLRMARSLERAWPGVVQVIRRFRRPQHWVDWTRFKTPLKRTSVGAPIPWGIELEQMAPSVRHRRLRRYLDEAKHEQGKS
ncbi:MAG: hypothetical protein L0191_06880 [Acidobacteria bacterium]|nr:hypothetical protein [Acidobacteriota bacterium]